MLTLDQAYELARLEIAKDKIGLPANSRRFIDVCADFGDAFLFGFTWADDGKSTRNGICVLKDTGSVSEADTLFDDRFEGRTPKILDIMNLVERNQP